ncbi:metal-dependent hydrolase [Acidovorax sp.]|uniref:metal-dependent hydrolase n=1 Tax=Acidovorax sp. TaxID=1872122 RepID=UPI00391A38E3
MDSVSQLVLGAAVTISTLGRRTAVWKAALWGGIAGTLPDLDALVDHGDAILNMVLHRSESHSLFYLTALSLPLAWAVSRLHGEPTLFRRWWLALWLALVTHPLLDWFTVYGTQLLLPFTSFPYAIGSVFIIDPLYTLPLLVGVVAALVMRQGRGLAWARGGLVASTAYLAWSVVAQHQALQQIMASPPEPQLTPQQVLVTPAPFNTLLWRAVVVTPTHYYEGYTSLLDDGRPVRWARHARGADLYARHSASPLVTRVANFSQGFFKMSEADGNVFITDLRMGNEPTYTFHFNLGPESRMAHGGHITTQQWQRPDLATALPWLWQRMWGRDVSLY